MEFERLYGYLNINIECSELLIPAKVFMITTKLNLLNIIKHSL